MQTHIQNTERLIREINHIHAQYSQDYFETGKVAKVNLSRTLQNVPIEHILSYRLVLHEAINDYLAFADTRGIDFFYRVKTAESIYQPKLKNGTYPHKIKEQIINTIQSPTLP